MAPDMMAELAGLSDVPELVNLRLLYLAEDLGPLRQEDEAALREALPDYLRRHLNRDLSVCVVRRNGRIAACAFLLTVEKPMSPAFRNGRTGTVLNVYTRPEYRRQGFGTAVMGRLLHEAKQMALCLVELKATADGYSLYRNLGFQDGASAYHLMRWINPVLTASKE